MLCTYIYFLDIGSFVGDEIPPPPNDPGVSLANEEMAYAEDQADDKTSPHDSAQIPAGVRCKSHTRFRMYLGDQLC